jgi:hypothetical protein
MEGIADGLRQFDFLCRGGAEAGADGESALEGLEDRGMAMAEQQRSPGADVIDVFVAIDIEDVRPLAAGDEHRLATDTAEGAHRGVDAAGDDLLRTAEEFFGLCVGHAGPLRGTMRLKPRLMPMS